MSYVEAYVFDFFISHVREDDEQGWITQFVAHFEVALNLELRRKVSIFFDKENRFAHLPSEYVQDNIRSSAVFVPLLSPSYVARGWEELNVVAGESGSAARIAPVEIAPVKQGSYPAAILGARLIPFWVSERVPRKLTHETDPKTYSANLARFTKQTVETLRNLRLKSRTEPRVAEDSWVLNVMQKVKKQAEDLSRGAEHNTESRTPFSLGGVPRWLNRRSLRVWEKRPGIPQPRN
jgi:hypothetical protein